ncbi:hypothetical protein EDC18_11273 [Natranaerovirga pectinivora]|uniref:Uncharacterized protein n=1 Tax=Natranaerovirga pectinivora TaxID=682400 RepID=A0A4R3MES1_9FIRM|nr:hypothetical protein [Natranaerovirga pectinivora]TCT12301.1 hypothetical protein EDC18_11273 [Natranaerovirga pectinivora]
MFRLWGKIYKNNKIIKDTVFQVDNPSLSRTQKVNQGLEEICYTFDIGRPLWLLNNEKEMPKYNRTNFIQDHFIETIPFDYLEIEIIEDDKEKNN